MIEKQNRQTCCGCGIKPPQSAVKDTDSSALLSTRFGWRVVRSNSPTGKGEIEWRCPACWEEYRAHRYQSQQSPPKRA
jgi:hypothetical protein